MQAREFEAVNDRQTFCALPGALTLLDLPAIYRDLCRELPLEAIQRTKGKETRKGYDTDGYGYQFCVDLLNEVVGFGHWRIIAREAFCDEGEYNNGRKAFEVGYDVTVQLGNWTPAGFEVLAESPCTPGGHVSALKSDARKGALTNAIKKAFAFFGLGAAAYRGELDDDNLPPEGRQAGQGYTSRTPPPQGRSQNPPLVNGGATATDRQIGRLKGSIDRAAQTAGRPDLTHKVQSFFAAVLSAAGLNIGTLDELSKAEASYLIDNADELVLQAVNFLSGNGEAKLDNGKSSTRQSTKNIASTDWPDKPPAWMVETAGARQTAGNGNGNGRRRLF